MAKKSRSSVSTAVAMRVTQIRKVAAMRTSTDDDDQFLFGWENTALDPLIYVAREIVDQAWPNTPTPDITAGVWDHTPIMQCVLIALRRGIALSRDVPDDVA